MDNLKQYKKMNGDLIMNDILEELKVISALNSEMRKLNYRKQYKTDDVNILDFTIIEALEKQISKEPESIDGTDEWLCPSCNGKVGNCIDVDDYCKKCGQRIKFN